MKLQLFCILSALTVLLTATNTLAATDTGTNTTALNDTAANGPASGNPAAANIPAAASIPSPANNTAGNNTVGNNTDANNAANTTDTAPAYNLTAVPLPAGISAWPTPLVSGPSPPAVPANLLTRFKFPSNISTTVRNETCGAATTCSWTCSLCLGPDDHVSCPDKNTWGITFDDGPTEFTSALLDNLKAKKITATFFVIGSRVLLYPDILRRAYAEGHHIAVHTWTHPMLTDVTNDQVISELWYTAAIINQTIGVWPQYMRPPYGDIDDRVRAISKALGMTPIIWSDDTNDWRLATNQTNYTAASITNDIKGWVANKASRSTGPITLEHDHFQQSRDLAINSVIPLMSAAFTPEPIYKCIGASAPAPYYTPSATPTTTSAAVDFRQPRAWASIAIAMIIATVLL